MRTCMMVGELETILVVLIVSCQCSIYFVWLILCCVYRFHVTYSPYALDI